MVIEAQASGEGGDTFALAEFADAALIAVEVGKTSEPRSPNASGGLTGCARRYWERS